MLFESLFERYFNQVSLSLIPTHKKALLRIYLKEIRSCSESLGNSNDQNLLEHLNDQIELFQNRYDLTFKPLTFPENSIREKIKSEVKAEWSGFFKSVSVLIDNHDFYKAIEERFQRNNSRVC